MEDQICHVLATRFDDCGLAGQARGEHEKGITKEEMKLKYFQ